MKINWNNKKKLKDFKKIKKSFNLIKKSLLLIEIFYKLHQIKINIKIQ